MDRLDEAEHLIGYSFQDRSLLEQALSHSSAVDQRSSSNERLEFLGDAVLGFVVCCETFSKFPQYEEGEMTKIKSAVVSRRTCAEVADELDLAHILQVGKGMGASNSLPNSVTGAAYEAIIGAIYLDSDLDAARAFVIRTMSTRVDEAAKSTHQDNYKSVLQQVGQKIVGIAPLYVVLDEKGPDHEKCFEISVDLDGRRFPSKWAASKKQAEQLAALAALIELDIAFVQSDGSVEIAEIQGE